MHKDLLVCLRCHVPVQCTTGPSDSLDPGSKLQQEEQEREEEKEEEEEEEDTGTKATQGCFPHSGFSGILFDHKNDTAWSTEVNSTQLSLLKVNLINSLLPKRSSAANIVCEET